MLKLKFGFLRCIFLGSINDIFNIECRVEVCVFYVVLGVRKVVDDSFVGEKLEGEWENLGKDRKIVRFRYVKKILIKIMF